MTELEPLWLAAEHALRDAPPAHDIGHVRRVASSARRLAQSVGADVEITVAAAILHELVNLPKNHPDSSRSGELCAVRAAKVLADCAWPDDRAARVAECIREHAWSRGLPPTTLEAAVLQDADRLDAIGAIGVARCLSTCGEIGRVFYSADDPFCDAREPDDKRFGIDHFAAKLLRIGDGLHTAPARREAAQRTSFLRAFLAQLRTEVTDTNASI